MLNYKRLFSVILLGLGISSTSANASIVDLEVGGLLWYGQAEESKNISKDFSNSLSYHLWGKLEHPILFVPNIQARVGNYYHNRSSDKISMTYGDVIGYYNLIDLTPIKLDLGLGGRFQDFDFKNHGEKFEYNSFLPFGYVGVKFDIPTTGFAIKADVAVSDLPYKDKTKFVDSITGVEYNFGSGLLEYKVDVGYRYLYQKQNESNGSLKTIIKGPYIGGEINF